VQRKRTSSDLCGERKGSRSLGPPEADCPALLKITGRCETRPPLANSDSPRAIPVIFPLLGYVKWQKQKNLTIPDFTE